MRALLLPGAARVLGDRDGRHRRGLGEATFVGVKPPPLTLDLDAVPDHLPGEPPSTARTGAALGVRVVITAALVTLLSWALLALWVPYLALVEVYGWPPNVPRRRQIVRYLRAGWTVAPPPPGLSAGRRAWLTILVLRKAATIPLRGLAWLLDEVLYGRRLDAMLPPEFAERDEGGGFRTDTFEAGRYVAYLNQLSPFYGVDFAAEEFRFARLTDTNRTLWEDDFVRFLERTGRKRLLLADGPRRLFVKGHFLAAAPALARRFPNARFLTMIRAPERRLQSAVHYLRANPLDSTLGPPPWSWLAGAIVRMELSTAR